jgi:hypothetical protein
VEQLGSQESFVTITAVLRGQQLDMNKSCYLGLLLSLVTPQTSFCESLLQGKFVIHLSGRKKTVP